jgi:hypothetical protein
MSLRDVTKVGLLPLGVGFMVMVMLDFKEILVFFTDSRIEL